MSQASAGASGAAVRARASALTSAMSASPRLNWPASDSAGPPSAVSQARRCSSVGGWLTSSSIAALRPWRRPSGSQMTISPSSAFRARARGAAPASASMTNTPRSERAASRRRIVSNASNSAGAAGSNSEASRAARAPTMAAAAEAICTEIGYRATEVDRQRLRAPVAPAPASARATASCAGESSATGGRRRSSGDSRSSTSATPAR